MSRRLCPTYSGNALRVRRDSDNAETDIGFDADGYTDTDAIETHCTGGEGLLVTVYDQSGNGHDLSDGTAAQQLRVCTPAGSATTRNGALIALTRADRQGVHRADTCGIIGTAAITAMGVQYILNTEIAGVEDAVWGLKKRAADGDSLTYRAQYHTTPWDVEADSYNVIRRFVGVEDNETWHMAAIRKAAGATGGAVQLFRSGSWLSERGASNPSQTVSIDATGATLWSGDGTVNGGGRSHVAEWGLWEERLGDSYVSSYYQTAKGIFELS